jgi:hypothetical protein
MEYAIRTLKIRKKNKQKHKIQRDKEQTEVTLPIYDNKPHG